jgi:hypothetical protein
MQELGLENAWVSELIFTSLFVAFILWTFSPFVFARKRFYTSLLYSQVLSTLVGEGTLTSMPPGIPCPMQRQLGHAVAKQTLDGARSSWMCPFVLPLHPLERL